MMFEVDKDLVKEVCRIPSTMGTFEAMNKYPEMWNEKIYKLPLGFGMELQFWITKSTGIRAFPVYLPLDVCTDVKKLVFDLLNTKDDEIDYTNKMSAFGVCGKTFSEAVKEYGYFGSDPVFYEGIKVHRKIVPTLETYRDVSDLKIDQIKEVIKDEDY